MKVVDGELSQTEIEAGLAVMKGEFETGKVMAALKGAGVSNSLAAAEALVAREVRLGHIRRVTRGIYQQN